MGKENNSTIKMVFIIEQCPTNFT